MRKLMIMAIAVCSLLAGTAVAHADGQGSSAGPAPCTHSDSWLDALDPNYPWLIYFTDFTHCEYQTVRSAEVTTTLQAQAPGSSTWAKIRKSTVTTVFPGDQGDVFGESSSFTLGGGYVGCCWLYRLHSNVQVTTPGGTTTKATFSSSYIASGFAP